ncbi:8-amino-7-oxononanoate synthase [candidate division TA06 bacterium B3_TA06]|uniref:8-amino-7-oxononanoate synthase n=1 Tax=candidate division TA06 bacterium B3_TA06 TaxID=2012487 RepID=A0A532UXK4_UNCT6|nr:MAG: 8-amino-7-oxononanoate synthase [candidate division TA06 bacterium B3_TA06]
MKEGDKRIMRDLFAKCGEEGGYFSYLRMQRDRYFTLPILEGMPGPHMVFQGRKVIQWAINNYLGLVGRPELIETAREAAARWGVGAPMGSRFMTGNTERHTELERRLARFSAKESAILFNYGYLGVIGTITSMIGKDDVIVIDKLAHASMMDAAFATRQFIPFRHNDMVSLERALRRASRDREGGVLVVVEGVYGMTGDLADLPGIVELKNKYGARLFVDDAHGFGTMGKGGGGIGFHYGLQDEIDIYFGTFAKAFAAIGGFSSADDTVVEYIRYNARTQIFAKSLPMVVVEVLIKAIDIVESEPKLVEKLWENARKLQNGLRELGFDLGNTASPVTPVYIPAADLETAIRFIHKMRDEKGIFVSGVMYPVVPKGVLLCRMIPTAAHTEEDIEITLKAFREVRDEMKLW